MERFSYVLQHKFSLRCEANKRSGKPREILHYSHSVPVTLFQESSLNNYSLLLESEPIEPLLVMRIQVEIQSPQRLSLASNPDEIQYPTVESKAVQLSGHHTVDVDWQGHCSNFCSLLLYYIPSKQKPIKASYKGERSSKPSITE